jgi:hypothetical protein
MAKEEAIESLTARKAELEAHQSEFTNFRAMMDVLSEDITEFAELALRDHRASDSAQGRLFEPVFALIEGLTFGLKQLALTLSEHGKGNFSQADLALLAEQTYDLDDKGRSVVQQKFIPLQRNIKFTLDACIRTYEVQHTLDFGGNGWCSLQEAIKIRNRLTHPKTVADFILSDDELGTVSVGLEWFLTNLSALVDGMYADVKQTHRKKG